MPDYRRFEKFVSDIVSIHKMQTDFNNIRTHEQFHDVMDKLYDKEVERTNSARGLPGRVFKDSLKSVEIFKNTKVRDWMANSGDVIEPIIKSNNEGIFNTWKSNLDKKLSLDTLEGMKSKLKDETMLAETSTKITNLLNSKENELRKSIEREEVQALPTPEIMPEKLDRVYVKQIEDTTKDKLRKEFGNNWLWSTNKVMDKIQLSSDQKVAVRIAQVEDMYGKDWAGVRSPGQLEKMGIPREVTMAARIQNNQPIGSKSWTDTNALAAILGTPELNDKYFKSTPINGKILTPTQADEYLLKQKKK